MIRTEIMKNNTLIAEFVGLKIISDGISLFDTNYKALGQYDKSWDWLMPVVEKIEQNKFVDEFEISYCSVYGYSFRILPALKNTFETITIIYKVGENTKINGVYGIVIEFIKWYNSQNNPNE